MAAGSSRDTSVEELTELLLEDINKNIVIVAEKCTEESRKNQEINQINIQFRQFLVSVQLFNPKAIIDFYTTVMKN